jgi:hypothetical protein
MDQYTYATIKNAFGEYQAAVDFELKLLELVSKKGTGYFLI